VLWLYLSEHLFPSERLFLGYFWEVKSADYPHENSMWDLLSHLIWALDFQ